MLFATVAPSLATETAQSSFIFDSQSSVSALSSPYNVTLTYDSDIKAAKATVSGNASDPQLMLSYGNGAKLSADEYKYLVFTYMVPSTASASATSGEIFLSAGSVTAPAAGKSVKLSLTRGGFVTEKLDLSSCSWWKGSIHSLRLDIFDRAAAGDTMYIDSVIFCKTAEEATLVAKNRSAEKGGTLTMPTDYYCDSYEWEKYTSPFWKGGIVYNEAVYPIRDEEGNATFRLMYTPDRVTAVYDAEFKVKYTEGVDYKVSGDTITFLNTGSVSIKDYTYLHPTNSMIPSGYNGWSPYYKRHAAGDGKYDYWSPQVARQYINVTYTHSDAWKGPVPAQNSSALPLTEAAIKNSGTLNIVYYGDSICGGARASGYENIYPYAEWWNQQITTRLREGYGVTVSPTYSSVGGSTASSMSSPENIAEYVTPYKPDLVVIEFGVNDSQNEAVGGGSLSSHKSTYKNAVLSIISQIRANTPNCEFLLVAPYYSNNALFKMSYFEACTEALYEIAETVSGTTVADVTAVHEYLLGIKNYADFSGDNLCHPNDYMSRIFSQVCLEAIVPGGVPAYEPEGDLDDNITDPTKPSTQIKNNSYAAPNGNGWYWSEDAAYGFISNYGTNGQDIILTADICLLPASEESCAHFYTNDSTGGIWIYPDRVKIGETVASYRWGDVSWANWHTVSFAIKNGAASVSIDGKLILLQSVGYTAYTGYQMLFSHYGSMVIDNLSLKSSTGHVYFNCDFENTSAAQGYMGDGLGTLSKLSASTLKFDLNGTAGSLPNQIKLQDIDLAVTDTVPEREGYTFLGWSTDKNATAPEYESGATYSKNSSATLYAVWQSGTVHTHSFGDWVTVTKPTCIDTGLKERTCACGEKEQEIIRANGHTEGETEVTPPTCTVNGRSLVCCTVCGYHISDVPILAEGHKYKDGVCTVCCAPESGIIAGDVDLDTKLTAKDVNLLKKIADGTAEVSEAAMTAADVNSDGKINSSDVSSLAKTVSGD